MHVIRQNLTLEVFKKLMLNIVKNMEIKSITFPGL